MATRKNQTIRFRKTRMQPNDLDWSLKNNGPLEFNATDSGRKIRLVMTEIGPTSPKRRRIIGPDAVGFIARVQSYDGDRKFRLPEIVTGWIKSIGRSARGEFYC